MILQMQTATEAKAKIAWREAYHKDYDRISSTMLKQLAECPERYRDIYVTKVMPPDEPTMPMYRSSAIHAVCLEGATARSCVGVYPDHNPMISKLKRLTGPQRDAMGQAEKQTAAEMLEMTVSQFNAIKPGKQMREVMDKKLPKQPLRSDGGLNGPEAEKYREAHPEYQYWLTRDQYDEMKEAIASLRSNDVYRDLIDDDKTLCEHPIRWECPGTGLKCRGMIDFVRVTDSVVYAWDVKVTPYATDFSKFFTNQKTWIQHEHYCSGLRQAFQLDDVRYFYLCLEPEYPYRVTVYSLWSGAGFELQDDDAHWNCQCEYENLMASLKKRIENQDWQSRKTKGVNPIEIPKWTKTFEVA